MQYRGHSKQGSKATDATETINVHSLTHIRWRDNDPTTPGQLMAPEEDVMLRLSIDDLAESLRQTKRRE